MNNFFRKTYFITKYKTKALINEKKTYLGEI